MPASADIYANIQHPRPVNVLADMANAAQIQGMRTQNQLAQLKMDEYQRGIAEQQELRSALSGANPDPYNALLRLGRVKEANEFQKGQTERKKSETGIAKDELEMAIKKAEHAASVLSTAKDQPTYDLARQTLAATFGDGAIAKMPPQFDPAYVQAEAAKGITYAQRLTDLRAKEGHAITVRGQDLSAQTSTENNKRSVGAQYAIAQATRDAAKESAQATRDAASIKDRRDTEMKLSDDYRAQSKNFKEVADAANRVKAALPTANQSAASTLAAATSFMKMLDPGSVVRESELGMALAATGAFDRLANYYNTLKNGKVLTTSQVKDFDAITGKILEAAKEGQRRIDTDYRGKAKQYGLREDMVLQELGQSTAATPSVDDLLKKYGGK